MVAERHVLEIGIKKLRRYIHRLEAVSRSQGDAAWEGEIPEPVEYTFRRLVVLSTNLANHLIARWRLPTPDDPRDVFAVLADADLLPSALAERLRDVAVLRMSLAHGYGEIPAEAVRAWVPARLDDFAAFADAMAVVLLEE